MGERSRFWKTSRWRDALRPDADLAQAEGLAAGTGLLTGTVVRTTATLGTTTDLSCPQCGGEGDILVVDLIEPSTTLRCRACLRRWTIPT